MNNLDICFDCDITDKLNYCCGSNPETGESALLTLDDGSKVNACPGLDSEGLCNMKNSVRPSVCGEYACHKMYEAPLYDLLSFNQAR